MDRGDVLLLIRGGCCTFLDGGRCTYFLLGGGGGVKSWEGVKNNNWGDVIIIYVLYYFLKTRNINIMFSVLLRAFLLHSMTKRGGVGGPLGHFYFNKGW